MQLLSKATTFWHSLPPKVQLFLSRAIVLFIVWKLLYHLLLFPARFPDQQLTRYTAASTTVLYAHLIRTSEVDYREEIRRNPYGTSDGTPVTVVYINNKRGIGIADGCNGLELYILYIGFLFCFPLSLGRKLTFAAAGIAGIFLLNSFRCFGLVYLFLNQYSFAEFAHHYLFKIVIYAVIFFTWTRYVKPYVNPAS